MKSDLLEYSVKELNYQRHNLYLLDYKSGDVTGNGEEDNVYLIGSKDNPSGIFIENITLVVKDGATGRYTSVQLETNDGYGPSLFLADFTGDGVLDIKISIDSGGSGGLAFYYIYSFNKNQPQLIFDYQEFNQQSEYEVNYQDFYKVEVINKTLNKIYIIDISDKDTEYLAEIYYADGTLKEPIIGDVIPLGGLFPIVFSIQNDQYNLLASQRIIGRYNADGLGFIQNYLIWECDKWQVFREELALFGREYQV